jgi:hypothetical protein
MAMRPATSLAVLLAVLVCASAEAAPRVAEFGLPLNAPAGARAADAGKTRTGVLRPGRRFDLVGLRWRGAGELVGAEIRTRHRGHWRAWTPLASADDHGPDGAPATRGSDPVWAGGADALQLRWRRAPSGMRLRFVRVTHRVALPARPRQASAGPALITREQWDPSNQCPPRSAPEYGTVQMAFVHHTVSQNEYTPEASPAMVLAICRYHRNSNGWNDIGYNFLVDRYGRLFEGRAGGIDKAVVGAQAQGWNSQSTSVSNIGTFSDLEQSDEAIGAMGDLLAWKLGLHGIPVTGQVTLPSGGGSENRYPAGAQVTFERISGHRDGGKTECPGDALYAQLPDIRAQAAGASPLPPPAATVTLSALSTQLLYPEPARLTGTVSGAGEVWVQVAAGKAFRTVSKVAPNSDGTWAAEVPLTRTYDMRALHVGTDGAHLSASAPVRVTLQPTLTATTRTRVLAGRSALIRGTIAPQERWLSATLWVAGRSGRFHWVRRVGFQAANGRYALRLPLRKPGLYRVRVQFRGTKFAAAAQARDLHVRAVRHRRDLSGGSAAPAG